MTYWQSVLITFICCINVAAQQYDLSLSQSNLIWTGRAALGGYSLSGSLQAKGGRLHIKGDSIHNCSIEVNMMTLKAENKQLEAHLRSKDFFEVDVFSLAHFQQKGKAKMGQDQPAWVDGMLTIKEQCHALSGQLQIYRDGLQVRCSGTLQIDRTKFGIRYNSPSFFNDLKDQAIADEFELMVDLYFDLVMK